MYNNDPHHRVHVIIVLLLQRPVKDMRSGELVSGVRKVYYDKTVSFRIR